MLTIIEKQIVFTVTNTMESPYENKKNRQMAVFSVVTPEQSKYNKPVDMAILNKSQQGELDLISYINELLRTNKPELQSNTVFSRHLRILEDPMITPQYRLESSKN